MTDPTPRIIEIDSAVKLLGILCYSSTTLDGAIEYYQRRYGKSPDVVYRLVDGLGTAYYWVVIR
jgi:hypothetical protein